jgi:hypothetical protein
MHNDRDMIQVLIENGAMADFRSRMGAFNGNSQNQFGSTWFTPIHVAAAESKLIALQVHHSLMRLLICADFDVFWCVL